MNECKDEGMNNWRVNGQISRSPADTYIEWQFEQKCQELSNGNDILTEWREKKRQYKAWTDTIVFDFQHFSRHDSSHSVNILEAIEMLLGKDRVDQLSAGDLWLLLECAYKHDIGMTLTYEELLELWENNEFKKYIHKMIYTELLDDRQAALFYTQMDNLIRKRNQMEGIETEKQLDVSESWEVNLERCLMYLVASYIRKQHAERLEDADKRVSGIENSVIPDRLYKTAITASVLHGESDYQKILTDLKECTKGFGNGKMHPRFACAMLRVGDVLDIENNRFNIRAIRHFGDLPQLSTMHRNKHKAVTHLKITRSQIEVEALSSDIDVCRVLADDFQWIDEEVQNLICYWNHIAPEELDGCTLKQSQCCVYYKKQGNLYDAGMHKSIKMDTKKLIDLFMGNNIYDNDMEFIREYLQNALDATKMQLWLDIKDKRYRNKINPGIKDLKELTPLDLSKDIFENYPINVEVEIDWEKLVVDLKICDRGIGMEKSCIDTISKIGQGWRERKSYAEELYQMPDWLKPTGGFGIGIQSAFMTSDKIVIITRSREEIKGHKITIESPTNGGHITTEDYECSNIGTAVCIELNLECFQTWNCKVESKTKGGGLHTVSFLPEKDKTSIDFFDQVTTLEYIRNFLKDFIELKMNHRLFPVTIINSNRSDIVLETNFLPNVNFWEHPKEYLIWSGEEGLDLFDIKNRIFYGWVSQRSVLYKMDVEKNNETFGNKSLIKRAISFKNIVVYNDMLFSLPFMRHINLVVDVMGGDVKEMLMLNRNAFREEFAIKNWLYILIHRYFSRLLFWYQKGLDNSTDTPPYDNVSKIITDLFDKNAYMPLLEMVYGDNRWNQTSTNEKETVNAYYLYFESDESDNWGEFREGTVDISKVCEDLKRILRHEEESGIIIKIIEIPKSNYFSSIRISKNFEPTDSNSEIEKRINLHLKQGGYIINDNELLEMMNMLFSSGEISMEYFYINQPGDHGNNIECVYITYNEQQTDAELDDELFYKNSWQSKNDEQRFHTTMKGKGIHQILWVDLLPYYEKKGVYLISPINSSIRADISSLQNQKRVSWEEFKKHICEDLSYKLLIQWVTDHQVADIKVLKPEIQKEYEKYLKKIYDYNLQDYY